MFETLFNYIDMISVGRKPGLPAFNGTLIFIALLQVPAVLFERRPELLEDRLGTSGLRRKRESLRECTSVRCTH